MKNNKFRGWSKDLNKWVYGAYFSIDEGEDSHFIIDNCKTLNFTAEDTKFTGHPVDRFSVGQYTMLQDNNDNDMYDGDILKINETEYFDEFLAYISFDNGTFVLVDKDGEKVSLWDDGEQDHYSLEILDTDNAEIVGNIYENIKLLKRV